MKRHDQVITRTAGPAFGHVLRVGKTWVDVEWHRGIGSHTRSRVGIGQVIPMAEHLRRIAMGGWLPIYTAPKSGVPILLWWTRCKYPAIGRWVDDETGTGWICDGDQCMPANQDDCTHWMPLPPAGPVQVHGAGEPADLPRYRRTCWFCSRWSPVGDQYGQCGINGRYYAETCAVCEPGGGPFAHHEKRFKARRQQKKEA